MWSSHASLPGLVRGPSVKRAPAVWWMHVTGKHIGRRASTPAAPSGVARKRELGSMNRNGWCRRPVNTNMRNRIGKGSTRVVDAINGSGAVWKGIAACRIVLGNGVGPSGSRHHRPERRSSIRQEKDTLRVVFCASKGHGATGHARGSGLHLAQFRAPEWKSGGRWLIPIIASKLQRRVRRHVIVA